MGHLAAIIWTAATAAIAMGCGSSSDSVGRGAVQVLQGEAAIEAGAEAAVGLAAAIQLMLIEPALAGGVTTGESSAADRRSHGTVAGVVVRPLVVACPLGGTVDGDCREERGRTVIRTYSENCATQADEVIVVANGRADVVLDGTGICGRTTLPDGLAQTVELRDFREEWRDGSTVVRAVESSRMKLTRRPRPGGCSASEGETDFDGDVTVATGGADMTLRMRGVALEVSSQGDRCDESAVVNGVIDIADRLRGARFVAELRAVRFMHRRAQGDTSAIAIEGVAHIDCLGEILLSTSEPMVLEGRSCPTDGTLALTVGGGAPSSLRFMSSGFQLDHDGDGVAEQSAPTCGSESLEVCM